MRRAYLTLAVRISEKEGELAHFFVPHVLACDCLSQEAQEESFPGAFRASIAKTEADSPRQASVCFLAL